VNVSYWHQSDCQSSITLRGIHNTPRVRNSHILASRRPRRPKISALLLAELGARFRTPHTLAGLDWGADVRRLAQFRVARLLYEALVPRRRPI
jgi:hypothetical protein